MRRLLLVALLALASPMPALAVDGDASPAADEASKASDGASRHTDEASRTTDDASATADEDALAASIRDPAYDPLEPVNRVFFTLNRGIDFILLDPISKAYGWLLPDFAKLAVRRMFDNLNSPSILANDLFQGELRDAGITTLRFAINSTLGLGGLLDPMAENGFPGHDSDFGQTLWRVGFGAGPYFVVPLLGPTTARDGIGDAVDGFLRPQSWFLGPGERLILSMTDGVTLRESHMQELKALRDSSVDYYAGLRTAFLLDREGMLQKEAARRAARPSICSYFHRKAKPDAGPAAAPAAEPAAEPVAPPEAEADARPDPAPVSP